MRIPARGHQAGNQDAPKLVTEIVFEGVSPFGDFRSVGEGKASGRSWPLPDVSQRTVEVARFTICDC
jgi:hypothetical protein